jgi:hypothetical protein
MHEVERRGGELAADFQGGKGEAVVAALLQLQID